MTVYADLLFALDFIIDFLALRGACRLCGESGALFRSLAAAFFGAAYSLAAALAPRCGFLLLWPVKAAVGLAVSLIAFGGKKRMWRLSGVFFAVSALFAGTVSALSGLLGGGSARFTALPFRGVVLCCAAVYAALCFVFSRTVKAASRAAEIEISLGGKSVRLRALADTGNSLREPVSGAPAAVCALEAVSPLFDGETVSALSLEPAQAFETLARRGRARGFMLLPYSSLGTKNALMIAFRADSVTQSGRPRPEKLIAVSRDRIGSGEWSAIISA